MLILILILSKVYTLLLFSSLGYYLIYFYRYITYS